MLPTVVVGANVECQVLNPDGSQAVFPPPLKVAGIWGWEVHDPDGTLVDSGVFDNGVTTAGLNDFLSVYFASGTQKTTWYVGLIDNAGFSAVAAADTSSSHAGWTENTGYSNSTRPTWTPAAPSGGSITNTSVVSFTINTTVNAKGAFLISDSTKGGTTGVLYATGLFGSVQALTNGQTLSLTYTVPLTAN